MKCFGMLIDGRMQPTGIVKRGEDATLLIVINEHHDMVGFTLPECAGGDTWSLLVDTNFEENNAAGLFKTGDTYDVTQRSVLLFALKSENLQKEQY